MEWQKHKLNHEKYWLAALSRLENLAQGGKWQRFLHTPYKYAYAMWVRFVCYAWFKRNALCQTNLFFGEMLYASLPSNTDLYLLGGKSHPSEIHLARFLVKNLREGEHFLDIGAHVGYFTRLAAALLGEHGKVLALEPSEGVFPILQKNTSPYNNIFILQKAISHDKNDCTFYEFEDNFSEYNSLDISQYQGATWFENAIYKEKKVAATTIDKLTLEGDFCPNVIKIDVEGGEWAAIQGGFHYLQKKSPIVVMEFVAASRHNQAHQHAAMLLQSWAYVPHWIDRQGNLMLANDLEAHLQAREWESDNLVFVKQKT